MIYKNIRWFPQWMFFVMLGYTFGSDLLQGKYGVVSFTTMNILQTGIILQGRFF